MICVFFRSLLSALLAFLFLLFNPSVSLAEVLSRAVVESGQLDVEAMKVVQPKHG